MSLLTQRRISLARQLAAGRELRRRSLAGGGLGLASGAAPSVSHLKLARSGLLGQQNPVGGGGLVARRGFGGNRRLICLLILLFLFFRPFGFFGGFGCFPFF